MTDTKTGYGLLELLDELATGKSISDFTDCAVCGYAGDYDHGDHEYEPDVDYLGLIATIRDYEFDPRYQIQEALDEAVLEVVVVRRGDLGSIGEVDSIELVVTTGGPDDRYIIQESGRTEHKHTEWFAGPGSYEQYAGTYSNLADYLFGIASALEDMR